MAQTNMGPLQDNPHVDILAPVCRWTRTVRVADQVLRELDEAITCAMGDGGAPGPVYLECPVDVLRTTVQLKLVLEEWLTPKTPRRIAPAPDAVEMAHSDCAAMARAFGAHGERVEAPADLADAIKRAMANVPAVVDA